MGCQESKNNAYYIAISRVKQQLESLNMLQQKIVSAHKNLPSLNSLTCVNEMDEKFFTETTNNIQTINEISDNLSQYEEYEEYYKKIQKYQSQAKMVLPKAILILQQHKKLCQNNLYISLKEKVEKLHEFTFKLNFSLTEEPKKKIKIEEIANECVSVIID